MPQSSDPQKTRPDVRLYEEQMPAPLREESKGVREREPWGQYTMFAILLAIVVVGGIYAIQQAPPSAVPPASPPLDAVSVELYGKSVEIYRKLAQDRTAFVQSILSMLVPLLGAVAGYIGGKKSNG